MLGETLDLCIVAEEVETSTRLAALNEIRCPFAQGHLSSWPLRAAEIAARLRR